MPETFFEAPTAPRVTHPETKPATRVEEARGTEGMAAFQRVPELVHWGDPYWVQPLKSEERSRFFGDGSAFLRRGGEARLLVAWHGSGKPVGRVACFLDPAYDERAGRRAGFFGFLDFMNDARVPEALLAEAARWLRARGAEEVVGPVAFTPWSPARGMLVDGFYDEPVLFAEYGPPSYPGFTARLGLETWAQELGYELDLGAAPPEALLVKAAEVAARDGLRVRPLDARRLEEEWELCRGISEEAHRGRPRYVAPPRDEWAALLPLVRKLLPILPEGGLVLEERDGRPAGFALALVDWNRVVKHQDGARFPIGWVKELLLRRTIDRVRLHEMCVARPGGARALPLVAELWRGLRARRYRVAHIPGVPEESARARALLERVGAKRTRAWRVYRLPASFPGETTPHRIDT
jgi:hypothetical protein